MSCSWRGRMGSSTGSTSATSTRRWTSAVDERSIPESSRSANLSSGLKSIQMATPQRQRAMSVSTCSRKATGGWGVQTEKIFWVSRMRSPQSRQRWRTRGKSSLGSWTISRTAAAAGSSLNRSQRVECPVCMEKVKPPMRLRLGTSSSVTLASIRTRETVACAILAITGEDEYAVAQWFPFYRKTHRTGESSGVGQGLSPLNDTRRTCLCYIYTTHLPLQASGYLLHCLILLIKCYMLYEHWILTFAFRALSKCQSRYGL